MSHGDFVSEDETENVAREKILIPMKTDDVMTREVITLRRECLREESCRNYGSRRRERYNCNVRRKSNRNPY